MNYCILRQVEHTSIIEQLEYGLYKDTYHYYTDHSLVV